MQRIRLHGAQIVSNAPMIQSVANMICEAAVLKHRQEIFDTSHVIALAALPSVQNLSSAGCRLNDINSRLE